jgi:hypothetical protein
MAVQYNPGIVTDGLVLCLDAANRKSYPGTGTASNDLSNTGNNGTLVNGVSYSTTNSGIFTFDGTDDTIDCGAASQIGSSLTALSVEAVVRPTAATTKIIAENGSSFSSDTFYLAQENSTQFTFLVYGEGGYDRADANFNYSTNTWYHLVGVWASGKRPILYANGNVASAPAGGGSTRTTLQNGNTNLFIGSRNNSSLRFSGNIALMKIYNIELSNSQVLQNFNALRGRFGI